MQVSNETTVHVRRPGNPKKWRAKELCEGKSADLALVTVEDDQFWTDELLDLQFVDVPELQASLAGQTTIKCCYADLHGGHAQCLQLWCSSGNGTTRLPMQCTQQAISEQFTKHWHRRGIAHRSPQTFYPQPLSTHHLLC